MHKIITLGLVAAILAGCSNSNKTTAKSAGGSELLYTSEWKLIELQGKNVPLETKAAISLAPGTINKITGNTGCNLLNGTFELSAGNSIKFSSLATTKMACAEENIASTEKKLLEVLSQADNWMVTSEQLQLKNGENVLATFNGRKPVSEGLATLNGTWELNYISGLKIAFDGLFPEKKPTITFNLPVEYATGNGGCNGFSSVIKVDGKKINFDHPLSTMMACEGNGEPEFFKALKTITHFRTNEDKLTLLSNENEVLRFTRK
ncbi:MAG: META domain-containing protein [Bacteroidota bacterium]